LENLRQLTLNVFNLLQNFLGFGQSAEIDIVFNDSENRKYAECRMDESGKKEKLLLYYDGESLSGKVRRSLQN
jgi:vacuolar protein sorting-associated protein 26